jgi:hypothetical protein
MTVAIMLAVYLGFRWDVASSRFVSPFGTNRHFKFAILVLTLHKVPILNVVFGTALQSLVVG